MDNDLKKISRREFLKISTASAAVMGLSGLGFFGCGKGEGRKVIPIVLGRETPHTCPFCAVGCGMISVFREKKLHSVEGDPLHPINQGALCAKGQASIEFYTGDQRVLKPLKRTNPRKGVDQDPKWQPISWERAYREIAQQAALLVKDRSPRQKDGFYYWGRESPLGFMGSAAITNEAGYQFKKLATLSGSNNIEHQARKCHSSTVAALGSTFGFGAMTNHFIDLENSACILIIGSNCAETHPVAWRFVKRAQEAGAKVIHVDPRFTRTSARADLHIPIRAGSDLALINFLANYAVENDCFDPQFINERTNVSVGNSFWGKFLKKIREMDLETASSLTGIPTDKLTRLGETFCRASQGKVKRRGKEIPAHASVVYALGLTQHINGVGIIRGLAFLQTVLGNIGKPGGGINALRGHSNVQGSTDLALLSNFHPGYVGIPQTPDDVRVYQDWKNQIFPDAWNWKTHSWYPKEYRFKEVKEPSHSKKLACYKFDGWRRLELAYGIFAGTSPGKEPQNETVISDLPLGDGYRSVELLRAAGEKKIKGMVVVGENPALSNPNTIQVYKNLSRLELLVVVDLFETETAHFADYLLPAASFLEDEGSKTNSGRWIQWSHRAVSPLGQSEPTLKIINGLYTAFSQAGVIKPPSRQPVKWNTKPEAVYIEIAQAAKLYSGMYDFAAEKNLSKRRIGQRKTGIDSQMDTDFLLYKDWAWSWPDNVRILYHSGETGELVTANGLIPAYSGGHSFWIGKYFKCPDPGSYLYDNEVIKKGKARLDIKKGGAIPGHMEPLETLDRELAEAYPAKLKRDSLTAHPGDSRFPYILTTYAVAEHFGGQTRHLKLLSSMVPDLFLEIGSYLAKELNILTGQWVRIVTLRGQVKARALVTERLLPLKIRGKLIHQVGLPYHWGFKGVVKGNSANRLTSDLTAPDAGIPESKVSVCNVIPIV